MEGRETSQAIERKAAQWVARMDRGPLDAQEQGELQHWLGGDARRRGAFIRARALWHRPDVIARVAEPSVLHPLEEVPAPARPCGNRSDRAPRRTGPALRRGVAALAASIMLFVLVVASMPMPVAYATAKGEMRRVPLIDGSTLTLNTESRVDVYEEDRRLRVRIRRGEVFVEASGSGEPLLVEVDGVQLRAGVAAFVVRKLDNQPAQVVVQDGEVGLPAPDGSVKSLAAHQRGSWKSVAGRVEVASLSADQMHRELAWREGKLAFHGERLAEAAEAFARYSDVRIVIPDPRLANASVTGLFAANNPAGFSRAVADVFGAEVRQETSREIVIVPED